MIEIMVNKVAQIFLSIFFAVGGVVYIIWGGPDGQILPAPKILAPLSHRLLLGSACIGAGIMGFLEIKRQNKSQSKDKEGITR
jgi:hypothetical protein